MSISTHLSPGTTVTIDLLDNDTRVSYFQAVVSDVDSAGIYVEAPKPGTGTFYPWSNIRSINY